MISFMNGRSFSMADWFLWDKTRMVPLIQARAKPTTHPEESMCRDGLYFDPSRQKVYRIRKHTAVEFNIEDILELIDESPNHR